MLLTASLIITGSETSKQRPDWQLDSQEYLFNGVILTFICLFLYYSVNVCYRDFEYLTKILINRSEYIKWQY
jgi:hypothetical protein